MSGDVHPVGTPWWRNRLQEAIAIDEQIASDREQQIEHVHLFEFLLNNSHTALRGCTICGMTWVGLMAGTAEKLRWHLVAEPEEDN